MNKKTTLCAMLSALAGCGTLPSMPENKPDSINKLADIVECEILTAFNDNEKMGGFDFSDWTSTYAITDNVTSNEGVGVDPLKWISPAGVDKLLYTANAKASREAYRNGKVEYSVFVLEKKSLACSRAKKYTDIHVDVRDFRLRDWVTQVSHHTERQMNSFSYSVKVTVIMGAGLGTDFGNGKWTATDGATHSRTNIETIDFTFSKIPKTPKPTRVVVVAPIPDKQATGPGAPSQPPKQGSKNYDLVVPDILKKPAANNTAKPPQSGPRIVPDSAIERNRGIMQLQQLDRVSPEFLNN